MKILGVIGWPVAHSRSPAMQNAALQHLDQDFLYLPFAVKPKLLRAAIEGAQALGVRGLNVTIPHKEAVLPFCQPDELAQRVGAVNTLVFEGDRILGSNTDVHGFKKLMEEADAHPKQVVVLGTGGAARAVVAALEQTPVTLVARTPRPFLLGGKSYPVEPWQALPSLLRDADLLVDATPRGLDDDTPLIDLSSTSALVLDLVVRQETALTRAAHANGLPAQTGAAMLLHQGVAALELFLGLPPMTAGPDVIEIMREALDAALAQ